VRCPARIARIRPSLVNDPNAAETATQFADSADSTAAAPTASSTPHPHQSLAAPFPSPYMCARTPDRPRTRATRLRRGQHTTTGTEGRRIAKRHARPLWQPELQPQPSHDATNCGAVAAATCTGGVGLRPPC
jgi:hypothetical protein